MKIRSKIKDYSVELLGDVFEKKNMIENEKDRNQRFFYLVDENVYNIYRPRITNFIGNDFFIIIPATEESKTLQYIIGLYRSLFKGGFTRNDFIITFGGGILQDISGFLASTIYRGVKWIFFPTTLLSQADSCTGSKTSLNFDLSKNQIGTFYPPDRIFIDLDFINTLSDEYFNSGLGEIIKVHLMAGNREFSMLRNFLSSKNIKDLKLLREIIQSSLNIKRSYFEDDEFDFGRRNLLNYGHTFGHALESASNFSISHGEAVMMGIGFANLVSLNRKILGKEEYMRMKNLLDNHYPSVKLSSISPDSIIDYMKKDKKHVGRNLCMILLKKIGNLQKYDDVSETEIINTYREFQKELKNA